jgi:hypothetical protein
MLPAELSDIGVLLNGAHIPPPRMKELFKLYYDDLSSERRTGVEPYDGLLMS